MTHTHIHTLPHTTNLTERVLRVRFCLPAYPFLHSFFLQITTGTTKTDTALPGTMTEETATVAIETGTGIATRDATETEDTTGIVIDGTMTGDLEDTTEDGDTEENARRDLVRGATTKCRSMALQRVTVTSAIEGETRNAEGTAWVPQNGGALPLPTQRRSR